MPAPWTRTIEELCADGVRGEVYAHEQFKVPGHVGDFLEGSARRPCESLEAFGWELVGAWETAMVQRVRGAPAVGDPELGAVGRVRGGQRTDAGLLAWRRAPTTLVEHRHRFLLVDSPLSPMRTGRQPSRDDRQPGWDDL